MEIPIKLHTFLLNSLVLQNPHPQVIPIPSVCWGGGGGGGVWMFSGTAHCVKSVINLLLAKGGRLVPDILTNKLYAN